MNSRVFFCFVFCLFPFVQYADNHRFATPLTELQGNTNTNVTQLMAGQHSGLTEPFIFVARDSENYARLRQIVNDVPAAPPSAFDKTAYVAIFLGQRRTSGFNIDFTTDQNGAVSVTETKPPPGAMLKMVLSSPFKVISIQVHPDAPIALSVSETWKHSFVSLRLENVEGPLAKNADRLKGGVELMRSGPYVTCFLNLTTPDSKYRVTDISSAQLDTDGRFLISARSVKDGAPRQLNLSGALENKDGRPVLVFQTQDGSILRFSPMP